MSKRAMIVALGGANLLLLAGLLYSAVPMPRVMAQTPSSTGGMICVTSRVADNTDALFLLDIEQGRLSVLVPQRDNGQLGFVTQRNIQDDFKAFSEAIEEKPASK